MQETEILVVHLVNLDFSVMTKEYLRYISALKIQYNLAISHHSNQELIHHKNLELILFLSILVFEGI